MDPYRLVTVAVKVGRQAYKPKLNLSELMPRMRELKKQGLTQDEIAMELGCSQGYVQKHLWRDKCDATGAVDGCSSMGSPAPTASQDK